MSISYAQVPNSITLLNTHIYPLLLTLHELADRNSAHRWDSDESYLLPASGTPVGAYLNISNIIDIAKANKVDAIHPGYGFLSESAEFAQACKDAGVAFVGPSVNNLEIFGDKTKARELAIKAGVSVSSFWDIAMWDMVVSSYLISYTTLLLSIGHPWYY